MTTKRKHCGILGWIMKQKKAVRGNTVQKSLELVKKYCANVNFLVSIIV